MNSEGNSEANPGEADEPRHDHITGEFLSTFVFSSHVFQIYNMINVQLFDGNVYAMSRYKLGLTGLQYAQLVGSRNILETVGVPGTKGGLIQVLLQNM